MENKKIGFFSRIKIAVTKLENYSLFLEEKTSTAVKYFLLMVLILVISMGIVETYSMMKVVQKGYTYIQNELPDFSYENGELQFSDFAYAYDEEFDMYLIADTSPELTDEKLQEYREEIKSSGIIFLKDKAIYRTGDEEVSYSYTDLASQYNMETLNKEKLIEEINSVGLSGIAITIFVMIVFALYIVEVISILMDWVVMAIFALITARICGIKMTFKQAFNMSIYALTLSIILMILYNIAYYVAGFYTDYFRVVYLLISYVYVVASILMMKSDLLKQQMEVGKIVEEQKKVHEEHEEPEEKEGEDEKKNKKPEKEKDKKEEKSDDDGVAGEPDGSEI